MKYVSEVEISRKEFNRINRLLDEIDFEDDSNEMTELMRELNAAEDSFCTGFYFAFENGAKITIDIYGGQHNYYDDSVWTSPDGTRDCIFDCSYALDEVEEFEVDDDVYICKFIIKED